MSIRIITDSASDIEQKEFDNVTVIPLTVTFDGKSYRDGVDITKDDFYNLLISSEKMPQSSLVSPHQFEETFKEVVDAGDEAIVITIASELSGTYQSARAVIEDYEDSISVIDSKQVSGAQKILVQRCMELIAQGKSRTEIVDILEQEKNKIIIFAAVDTLKYLLKGGRISKGTALVGGIIGIKPIITLDNGKLIAIGKVRGSKQSHVFLNKKVEEFGGIDFDRPYTVGYAGTDKSNLMAYIDSNPDLINAAPHMPDIVQIGSAVGTHCGPGAVLISFFTK